jgi:hypothetical protein
MFGSTIERWYACIARQASPSVDSEEKVVEDLFDFSADWDLSQLDLDFSGKGKLNDPYE